MQSAFAPLKTVPRNTNHRSNICSYTFVHTLKPRFPHSGTPLHDHGPATLTTSRRRQYRIDNAPRRSDLQCANAASNLDPLIRWQLGWTMHFIAIHLIDLRACAHARSCGGRRAMCEAISCKLAVLMFGRGIVVRVVSPTPATHRDDGCNCVGADHAHDTGGKTLVGICESCSRPRDAQGLRL